MQFKISFIVDPAKGDSLDAVLAIVNGVYEQCSADIERSSLPETVDAPERIQPKNPTYGEPEPEPEKPAKAPKKDKGVSLEDVRAAIVEATQRDKRNEVLDTLTAYGASKASEVPEDKWVAFIVEVGAL
jgi:hypothetical protein